MTQWHCVKPLSHESRRSPPLRSVWPLPSAPRQPFTRKTREQSLSDHPLARSPSVLASATRFSARISTSLLSPSLSPLALSLLVFVGVLFSLCSPPCLLVPSPICRSVSWGRALFGETFCGAGAPSIKALLWQPECLTSFRSFSNGASRVSDLCPELFLSVGVLLYLCCHCFRWALSVSASVLSPFLAFFQSSFNILSLSHVFVLSPYTLSSFVDGCAVVCMPCCTASEEPACLVRSQRFRRSQLGSSFARVSSSDDLVRAAFLR